jgi:hypothetical protein
MRTVLFIAGLLVSLAAQPQEIYRWVDSDGIVHYSDQPGAPGAQRIPYPGRDAGEPDAPPPPQLYESGPAEEPPVGPTYESLSILSPRPDEVFYGTDAAVNVQLELDRDLRPGDSVLVFLDSQRVPDVTGLSATLTGLTRGSHFLRAAVIDEAGAIVITSPQIVFHLRQPSVANPPTGPALRPPPPTSPRPPPPRAG